MLINCKIKHTMLMMKKLFEKFSEKNLEKLSEDTVSFTIFGYSHRQKNR